MTSQPVSSPKRKRRVPKIVVLLAVLLLLGGVVALFKGVRPSGGAASHQTSSAPASAYTPAETQKLAELDQLCPEPYEQTLSIVQQTHRKWNSSKKETAISLPLLLDKMIAMEKSAVKTYGQPQSCQTVGMVLTAFL